MRKVLIQDNFYKSVPLHKREKVEKLCEKIERQLNESNSGIFGTSIATQTKKFRNKNKLFKFKASDGDRIMFTYTKDLQNYRNEYGSGICLIEYISQHDEQNRRAKNFNENNNIKVKSEKDNKAISFQIEEAKEAEYNQYKFCFDLDKTIVYIKNENELSKLFHQTDDILEVYISNQQSECAYDNRPTILMGGAGSGKTLVCLHRLNKYKENKGKKAYFTYSEGLKNKSQQIFQKISSSSKDIEFYTFESYCLKLLELTENKFIDFIWFRENFDIIKKNVKLPSSIDAIDIWSEIRGIIKGYMGFKWARNLPISFKEINEISRKVLEHKYKYIEKYNNNERQIICEDTTEKRFNEIIAELNLDQEIDAYQKGIIFKDLEKIYKMSTTFEYKKTEEDFDKRILTLQEYLDLSSEVSIYSEDEKELIYAICINYQNYIDTENLYDDNDLAGLCIMKMSEKYGKPFQHLVVDEVQDLTELQIYLIYNLVEDKENVLFAGDIHQIINPTYFSAGRLRKLYSINNKDIYDSYLNKNYRSQKNIVNLANNLADIRRKYIAKRNEENEQLVETINIGQPLLYLRKNNNSLKQMLLAVNEKANAATIVADNEDKKYLESIMEVKANNIYTVAEIKGMEFEYIFCYNLIGKYSTYWDDIFDGKAKKNVKYRYYFNIFYVSITRARKTLCVYDEVENQAFQKELSKLFEFVDEYEAEHLYIESDDNGPEYWYVRAKELEETENFDKAILAYKKANADNKKILRCQAKLKAKQKEYDIAIQIMLQIREYKYAEKYAQASGNNSMIILSSMLSGDENLEKLEQVYGRDSVNEVLVKNIMNEDFKELIHYNYIENYILNNMLEHIDKINKGIATMTGEN